MPRPILVPVYRELPPERGPTLGDAFRTRNNNLIALRLLMAIVVVASHCYPLAQGERNGDLLYRVTRAWWGGEAGLTIGFICVSLFFVLSGFVITHSFQRSPNLKTFAIKRAARIYPPYVMAALFGVLIVGPIAGHLLPLRAVPGFVRDVLFLKQYGIDGIFPANPFPSALNGSLWSIKYEVVCYGLIAMLGGLGWLRRPRVIVGLLAGASAFYAFQLAGGLERMGLHLWWPRLMAWSFGEIEHWPRILTYHLTGMTLYLHRDRLPRSGRLAGGAIAALVVLGLIGRPALLAALPMLAGYVGLYIGLSTIGRAFTKRFDTLDLSYGCYLYAFPIQQLLVQRVPGVRDDPVLLFMFALPIVIGCAVLSARFVEQPTAARLARWKRQPTIHAKPSMRPVVYREAA